MYGKDRSFAYSTSFKALRPSQSCTLQQCISQKTIFVDTRKHSYVLPFSQRVPLRSS